MIFITWFVVLVIAQEFIPAVTEMRFVCPRPQNPSSTSSQRPCGTDGFKKDFDSDYTEVKPGPFTIHLEETTFRLDTPAKISLVEWGADGRSCMLLNHIPHNNAVSESFSQNPILKKDCKADDYPLGRCGSSCYITINIPDVECERCYLQLVTVQTPLNGNRPCLIYFDGESNCTLNYSCSNIRINPTEAGKGLGLETCQDYSKNLGGRWPFAEKNVFQASLGGSSFSGGHARFEMDHTNFLQYDISLGNVVPVPGRDMIFIVLYNGGSYSRLQYIPVTGEKLRGELGAFDNSLKALLMTNQLVLEISRSAGQSLYRNITRHGYPKYGLNRYFREGMKYSPSGWLRGPDFVGPEAAHPQAVYPHGQCAPVSPQYAATLLDEAGTLRTLVTYGIIEGEQVFLDAVIISARGSARQISFHTGPITPDLPSVADFPGEFITRNYAHGNIALEGQGVPNNLSAVVKVNTSYITAWSEPFKAVKALLLDDDDLHTALGTIQLLDNGDLKVTVAIINKTGDRTVDAQVSIKGPQPMDSSIEQFVVPISRTEARDVGGWVGHSVITVKDSYISHCLRLGAIAMEIKFPNQRPMSAQFDAITDWFCEGSRSVVCLVSRFSDQGGPVDKGLSVLTPHGFATVYMVSDTSLQYSITVRDLRKSEKVMSVVLKTPKRIAKTILGNNFIPSRHVSKAVTNEGSVDLDEQDVNDVASGRMTIVLFTSHSNKGEIFGTIPKLGETKPTAAAKTKSTGTKPKMSLPLSCITLAWALLYFTTASRN